ncbi:hypothetical protein V5O48_017978 [Marasmius crinis-equi]|uniref:Uncharacterized protein n=1 Tax=Marasmius crinis-equi TaxID=585013 RepID=A0ABR3EMG7_9AGAR
MDPNSPDDLGNSLNKDREPMPSLDDSGGAAATAEVIVDPPQGGDPPLTSSSGTSPPVASSSKSKGKRPITRASSRKDLGATAGRDLAAVSDRLAAIEESTALIREHLDQIERTSDTNHATCLRLIADSHPDEPINPDLVRGYDALWQFESETRQKVQSLASSVASMMPRTDLQREFSEIRGLIASMQSSTPGPMPLLPPLPANPAPLVAPTQGSPVAPASNSAPSSLVTQQQPVHLPPAPPTVVSGAAVPSATPVMPRATPVTVPSAPSVPNTAAPAGLFDEPTNLFPQTRVKRALQIDDAPSGGPSKRANRSGWVEMGYTTSRDDPVTIAQYVAGKLHRDLTHNIENAVWCRKKKGWIKIRFTDRDWATSFVARLSAVDPGEDIARFSAFLVEDDGPAGR